MRQIVLGLRKPASEVEIFGVRVPNDWGAPEEELGALRDASALLPAPWERILLIGGRDRKEFLNALLTQDVNSLSSGLCRPAAQSDRKGHLLADLWVLDLGERLCLRTRADRLPALLELLDRHRITERVDWSVAESLQAFLLLGPQADQAVRSLNLDPKAGEREGGDLAASGLEGIWMRVSETAEAEYLLAVSADQTEALVGQLLGGVMPPRLVGWQSFNFRRIETGSAWVGLEGDEERLVPELLPANRISYTKGCFLGQETLARLHHLGQLNWKIGPVRIASDTPPAPGTDLLDEAGTRVGWIAGSAGHPAGGVVALAYLHRRFRESPGPLRLSSGEAAYPTPADLRRVSPQ